MSYYGFVELAIQTILIFAACFVIGGLLRVQISGQDAMKLLIFFAVVALAGASMGAYFAPRIMPRYNQSTMYQ